MSAANSTLLQTGVDSGASYTVPKAGVVTSWSFDDGPTTVPGLKLKVGRSAGTVNTYKIVGEATAGTQTANAVNTYKTHIGVKAGDLIGIYENGGACFDRTNDPLDTLVAKSADVLPGSGPTLFAGGSGSKLPVSAKVVLDCVVPNLKGKTLKAAKTALKAANCTLGSVQGPRTGKVKSQKPAAGKTLKPGAKVNIKLG
jgi:beta-lactam-binding protein with PASTA domain